MVFKYIFEVFVFIGKFVVDKNNFVGKENCIWKCWFLEF